MLFCFFFNDTATTEIYTLSLHDALPILFEEAYAVRDPESRERRDDFSPDELRSGSDLYLYEDMSGPIGGAVYRMHVDRKSTRLNSSHANISYAVFCLKKKK